MNDWIPARSSNLFDLTKKSVDGISIIENYAKDNCFIKSELSDHSVIYEGFILADTELVQTICIVTFFKSSTSQKYIPRLEFKKILKRTGEVRTTKNEFVRISFASTKEGYVEFWKMIAFLYNFKNIVDIGNFEEKYQVLSNEEFGEYVRHKEKADELSDLAVQFDKFGIDAAVTFQSVAMIKLLKEYKDILSGFVDEKVLESIVTKWLDEDDHKYRKSRCLIFGLEFVNHKREGGASGDRYDLLTRIGLNSDERVLIELKGPCDDIFKVVKTDTKNDPKSQYILSDSLARAIPQILEYRKVLEDKNESDPELEKMGETQKVKIVKCIIVIGSNHNENPRWMSNLRELRKSLSSGLEIWTYSDLINKMDSTIQNLEIEIKQA